MGQLTPIPWVHPAQIFSLLPARDNPSELSVRQSSLSHLDPITFPPRLRNFSLADRKRKEGRSSHLLMLHLIALIALFIRFLSSQSCSGQCSARE